MSGSEGLCRRCGFCCNWVLFRHAPLGTAEVDWARRRRLPLVDTLAGPSLAIPCAAHHAEDGCGVYSERPAVCRGFRCRLLEDVEAGALPEAAAMAVVVEARVLADRIAQAVGDSTDLSTVRGLETLARLCGSNATQATRELLLDVGELRLLVRRRFVPAKA